MADLVQGSDAWKAIRLGKATGSRIGDIVSKTKSGYSASRSDYMAELLCERLTGQPTERIVTSDMRWGTDNEPLARTAYSFYTDVDVVEVGFVFHPRIADAGASPDGLVGDDGLLEIKCMKTKNHLETMLSDAVPEKYMPQIQFQLACTGRAWCDLCAYDPRLPEEMRVFIKRVERDDKFIATIEAEVEKFLKELASKTEALLARYGAKAA